MSPKRINSILGISVIIFSFSYTIILFIASLIPWLNDRIININIALPYWTAVFTMLISYIVFSFLELDKKMGEISNRTMPHLEIFQNGKEFHIRMAQLNSVATSIFATNFSYPPDQKKSGPVIKYYDDLHKVVRDNNHTLESFRVIANVPDETKAAWVFHRAISFKHRGKFSMAITFLQHAKPLQCVHIIVTKTAKYVFFFPPIPRHDSFRSFMIVDSELADLLISQFNDAWAASTTLIEGGILDPKGVSTLESNYPDAVKSSG